MRKLPKPQVATSQISTAARGDIAATKSTETAATVATKSIDTAAATEAPVAEVELVETSYPRWICISGMRNGSWYDNTTTGKEWYDNRNGPRYAASLLGLSIASSPAFP